MQNSICKNIKVTIVTLSLLYHCSISSQLLTLEDLDEKSYVYESDKWPENCTQVPSIGNGHLATVIKQPWVFMSGLFNGEETKSQRAIIPSTLNVGLKNLKSSSSTRYKLDTRIGIFSEHHEINGWSISLQWFAHRTILPILVFQVMAKKINVKNCMGREVKTSCLGCGEPIIIELDVSRNMTSPDIDLEKLSSENENIGFYHGKTKIPEHPELSKHQDFYLLHDVIADSLELKGIKTFKKWTFITSVHYSKDVVVQAYKHVKRLNNFNKLEDSHSKKWLKLWSLGRIDVQGNLKYSRATSSSLYYLLSSVPIQKINPSSSNEFEWSKSKSYSTLFTGLSPSGLPWGDGESYQGHTFWDAETWMLPAIMMLHYDLLPTLLHSRVRTMDVASRNANTSGLQGLRYPWESALTGIETAPEKECGEFQIHVNGDISMTILQYLRSSPNQNSNFPPAYLKILIGIGNFWLSRAEFNEAKQHYEIKGVMPPDEYSRCVNNSAYTNSVASLSLRGAFMAAEIAGLPDASKYEEAADKMYIPYDPDNDYHPEFDGYENGTKIKQADVVLMGFPLMMKMMESTRKNDLEYYEKVTSTKGPAMSDSMHAIGWLEVGNDEKAHESFLKIFQHIGGDFQIWTEEKGEKGASNFITGMGGFLQALLFGYGGLRILDDKLLINPSIMKDVSSITWYGVDYKGCTFDLEVQLDRIMTVTLVQTTRCVKVYFECRKGRERVHLRKGHPFKTTVMSGYLTVQKL